jgi:uncharacterized protein with HEPN domain
MCEGGKSVTEKDISLITKIAEWARNALEYVSGDTPKTFSADKKTAYACVLSIQQMGSLADRISLGARSETSQIPWDKMSLRGADLQFDCSYINLSRLSQTIKKDFPTLIQQMESAIRPYVMKNNEQAWQMKAPIHFKASLEHKPSDFNIQDCLADKVVELSATEFDDLVKRPLVDRAWIAENREVMYHGEDGYHCLLALGEGYSDGVLIEAEGYNYPRKAAYIPGARSIAGKGMGGTKLRDLMMVGSLSNAYLTHTDPEVGLVDAQLLDTLTDTNREDYAALLNADVVSIRCGDDLPVIVLGGIEPQILMDFHEAAMDHQRAEMEMGGMIP